MTKIKGIIIIDIERCKGCGVCVVSCPSQALTISKQVNSKGYRYASTIDSVECSGCANCAIICPDTCITVYRQKSE